MISFAVTAYDEMSKNGLQGRRIIRCIQPALDSKHIDEVVVVNDGSSDFKELFQTIKPHYKLRWYNNEHNKGVFGNKLEAVALCSPTTDWVITCDSDNQMDTAYIAKIASMEKDKVCWYCPSFAKPKFDYCQLAGTYNKKNLGTIIEKPMFGCCFNTGNQVVHRRSFLDMFKRYRDKTVLDITRHVCDRPFGMSEGYFQLVFDANDSFFFNMEWILAGNQLAICKGLEYEHHYSSGPDSNYARAPKEKSDFNDTLLSHLRANLKSGS